MSSNSFADRLRALLKKEKISQLELANQLNLPRNTIWRWVNGKAIPDSYNLQNLATLLHISVDELLTGEYSSTSDWVLTIKSADSFEEVINLARNNLDCISQITTKQGAALLLAGEYDIFADKGKFKDFIKQLLRARKIVLQNGQAMGWRPPKED